MDKTKQFLSHIGYRLRDHGGGILSYAQKYYLEAVSNYDGTFKMLRWNWAAFLGPLYWLTYRRLYQAALVVLSLSALGRVFPPSFYLWVIFGVHIFFGMYGTTYYLSWVIDRIQKDKKPLGVDPQLPIIICVIVEIYSVYIFLNRG